MEKRKDGRNAQTVASNKYNGKAYDRIALIVKKGNREILKDYCQRNNETVNGFINRLIAEKVKEFKPFD